MSLRPKSAVVCAVTGVGNVAQLSNRLHAVLAVGMRSNPTVSVYSDEPPAGLGYNSYFGPDDEYDEQYAPNDPRWREDYSWVLERVRENALYFVLASKEFRKRRELAMAAVSGEGGLLQELSPLFKNDREIVKEALKTSSYAYTLISDEMLKRDDELIKLAFSSRRGEYIYTHLPDDLKEMKYYMRLAVKGDANMISYLPESAKRDRQFMLELLEINPDVAEYQEFYKNDPEFWIAAVRASKHNIEFIPLTVPKTRELLLKMVQANGNVFTVLIDLQKAYFEMFGTVNPHIDWKMDIKELRNEPDFRLAAATAERNPDFDMVNAILNDLEKKIPTLVRDELIVKEAVDIDNARAERLEAYGEVLEKLAAAVPFEAKKIIDTIQELLALVNHPKESNELFQHRLKRDMGDMLGDEETEPSAKRDRVATEVRALVSSLRMLRCHVNMYKYTD